MEKKTCLITGGTTGIGKAAALALAKLGADVVIVGRDPRRTQDTVEWLKKESGHSKVSSLLGDLSSLKDVRRIATEFKDQHGRLDVLNNNAGAMFEKPGVSADGFELTYALNHLAYFAMTEELLPLLKASAPSRIISVSSKLHRAASIDFEAFREDKKYSGWKAYGRSKLANVLFTYALDRRLKGSGVTANCLHPGVVASGFGRNNAGMVKAALSVIRPFIKTPDQGAATTIYLASSREVEGVSGKYFENSREARSSKLSYDEALQEKLWKVSQEHTL